jgi:hypothetical protein
VLGPPKAYKNRLYTTNEVRTHVMYGQQTYFVCFANMLPALLLYVMMRLCGD